MKVFFAFCENCIQIKTMTTNNWGFCIDFCPKIKYNQKEIESIIDDYGGRIVLIDSNTGKQKSVLFTKTNNHSLSIGFHTVSMVSNDLFISLVLVFRCIENRRELVNGQLIKYGKIYSVLEYNVYSSLDEDSLDEDDFAYGKCVYKLCN